MLAENFLREFALLAGSTGGIQKLRELVLQLAVRGKLMPQNINDGRASDVAENALKEVPDRGKKQLVQAGQHPIPENWMWVTLGAISNYGETAKVEPGALDDPDFWVLELEDIEKSTSRLLAHVPFQKRDFRSSKNRFKEGQVLYGKLRPYLDKVIVADQDGCCTTEIVPFSVFGGIDPYFIRWCMKTPDFISYADGSTYGMNLPRMGTKSAIAAPIPLPPIAEQKRIVAKVDELMALCDELDAQQAKETELKRAAAASALHHLTEARTPEKTADRWSLLAPRFGELFDDLETIKALRVAVTDAAANGAFSTPSERAQFSQGTVDDVLVSSNSGWSPRCDNIPATSDEWGVLKVSAVTWGVFKPEENKRLPSDMEPRPQHTLGAGDILVSRANTAELVGRGVKVPEDYPRLMLSDKIVRLALSDAVQSDYFLLAFNASPVRAYFAKVATGTSDSMRNITRSHIKAAPIVFPPLAEQKRIVAKFDELMALCDRLEEQVGEGEQLNAALMASLVHALTGTDPDGGGVAEPAGSAKNAPAIPAPEQANRNAPEAPETKSARTPTKPLPEARAGQDRTLSVDSKFQEAVLVATIVNTFFQAGGEPIGNFRLQKAVYFARRKMGEHVGEMAYLKKAAGPYNPSMKYSGGIAIAKQKNWLREARGRFGFGHVPGPDVGDAGEWIDTYRFAAPARWVAEHFRYKKNEEWETLATVDYAIEHLNTLGIEPDAAQILQYIASDPEWRPKIEKLGLTEMSAGTAMLEVQALFSADGEDDTV